MDKTYRIATILILVTLGAALSSRGQTVSDYDGNVYQTVTIGDQVWMSENLKSTHYADGKQIDEIKSYNNSSANAKIYGRLYTWNAAMNGSMEENAQGACPNGWHLPSEKDWGELASFLGGYPVAGGKLKESGTEHWNAPNSSATNSSGFSALPAGEHDTEKFQLLNEYAVIWSSSGGQGNWAKYYYLAYDDEKLNDNLYNKTFFYSIRCIKDDATGVRERSYHGLLIYPNPFDHLVYFEQKDPPRDVETAAFIYNQNGQLISEFILGSELTKRDLHHLSPGLYYVKVMIEDRIEYQKVLKR